MIAKLYRGMVPCGQNPLRLGRGMVPCGQSPLRLGTAHLAFRVKFPFILFRWYIASLDDRTYPASQACHGKPRTEQPVLQYRRRSIGTNNSIRYIQSSPIIIQTAQFNACTLVLTSGVSIAYPAPVKSPRVNVHLFRWIILRVWTWFITCLFSN